MPNDRYSLPSSNSIHEGLHVFFFFCINVCRPHTCISGWFLEIKILKDNETVCVISSFSFLGELLFPYEWHKDYPAIEGFLISPVKLG